MPGHGILSLLAVVVLVGVVGPACAALDGLPRHDVRASIVGAHDRMLVVDRLTLWHPGGAAATFRCTLPTNARLNEVRWRSSRLEPNVEGDSVAVPLPYASQAGAVELEFRYETPLERSVDVLVLGRRGPWMPVIEGGGGRASVRLKIPAGLDVVAAAAPTTRVQARDGSLCVRFPVTGLERASRMLVGPWAVETVPVDGIRLEVGARDRELARRLSEPLERVVRGLSFLGKSGEGPRTASLLVAEAADLGRPAVCGLAVVASQDEYLTPTTDEVLRAGARLLWTSAFSWNDEEADETLLAGLVDYCVTAVEAGRASSSVFRTRLEQVEAKVRTTRPVPRWRRWKGRSVHRRSRYRGGRERPRRQNSSHHGPATPEGRGGSGRQID